MTLLGKVRLSIAQFQLSYYYSTNTKETTIYFVLAKYLLNAIFCTSMLYLNI